MASQVMPEEKKQYAAVRVIWDALSTIQQPIEVRLFDDERALKQFLKSKRKATRRGSWWRVDKISHG